jgi:hypothetical protein
VRFIPLPFGGFVLYLRGPAISSAISNIRTVDAFGLYESDAREHLMALPYALARSLPKPHAEAAASGLR